MGEDFKPKHSDTQEYSESTKGQFPKHLSPRHRTLMRKLLAGKELKDVAEDLGFTVKRASLVVNSPLFQEEMKRMQEQIDKGVIAVESEIEHMDGGVKAQLEAEALASLKVIIGLRDGAASERVKQVSALEILDRAGYTKTDKFEGKVRLDTSPGLLDAIGEAMKEMRGKNDSRKVN